MLLGCHLEGVALAYVAAEAHVQACVLKQVVDERSGGGLPVGSGYADFLRGVVAACEFYLGDHGSALGYELFHERSAVGNARALHDLVGRKHLALGVATLFEGDVPAAEHSRILFFDLPVVGQENIESFYFCEDRSANSAFGSSEYCQTCHYLIFNNASVLTASIIPIIQKRVTMRGSGMPFFW